MAAVLLAASLAAAPAITTPKEYFGFDIGNDYHLANYTQAVAYWKKLAQQSDRIKLSEIGTTAEGRPMYMLIITAPENHKNLDRYKAISHRLALAEGLTDEQARALATEGKSIVWIDGGLHATEVLGAQQLIQMVYEMASRNDPETLRTLKDVILLACLVNPDGMELVSNWYMRNPDPTKRSTAGIPRLYQKYIGHDNNRDFLLVAQAETRAVSRIFFAEWHPQIVYNHHQTGPAGTVLFCPPLRDPNNYHLDPLVVLGIDLVGAAMHSRFAAEGKPGATMRTGAPYSGWWNGGLRSSTCFHNMIGLLTETIGNPTPMEIPFLPNRQLAKGEYPYPVAPQKWHFRQSIEYSLTADRAVLDTASKHREDLLYRSYRMGKNSIERGSADYWTMRPKAVAAVVATAKDQAQTSRSTEPSDAPGFVQPSAIPTRYYEMLKTPAARDPRGYILPADQPDFLTATKFINTLIHNGVTVQRATAAFEVEGKRYPAGSYVVKTAQAFRPHILDMFEPQDHPDDLAYPGGPPIPPYDIAGYTLAFQMGVAFDRILDGFDGPFEKIAGLAKPPAGEVLEAGGANGYVLSPQVNDAFLAINRLLASGQEVYRVKQRWGKFPPGAIFIPSGTNTRSVLSKLATETGLKSEGAERPSGEVLKLRPVRIGLWDRYGGSMPSGWVRWLLEQFSFPFTVVYPQTLDAGDLNSKFDVLIFVDGAIPSRDARNAPLPDPQSVPEEFRGWLGNVSVGRTVPQLIKFMEAGGTVLTIGSSTAMSAHAGLPIASALIERTADGAERALPREKLYIPGSVLQVRVDNSNPLAYGMPDKTDVFFLNSPVFRLRPDAALRGVRPVAWFDTAQPLRSGWALGQQYLQDGVAVAEASVGKGRLVLYGPEITFRGQPHGTFKLLFNGITLAGAEAVRWP